MFKSILVPASSMTMGGCAQHSERVVIFGGLVRHVLAGTNLPILMAHRFGEARNHTDPAHHGR